MAEKKVVVQVLADTKPFIQSIMKLRKFAESVDSAQIRASNKVLKNLVQNAKINQKIQKITQKTAKLQQKVNKENEDSQEKVLKSAIKYGIVLDTIRRSFRLMKSGFMNGYEFGRGVVDPARTYGVDLTKATQANALYSAFGGKAGGGADVMAKFLQAQNEFRTTQTGPLKEAAGLFGLNPQTLMKGDLLDFIKEVRKVVKSRNLSEGTTQMMLQKLGLGYDAAIMRMVTGTDADFSKKVEDMAKIAQSTEDTLKAVEDTEKAFETMMTNIKTTVMGWATHLKPALDWANNKLGATGETIVAGATTVAGSAAAIALTKKVATSLLGKAAVQSAVGAAAGVGAGATAGAGAGALIQAGATMGLMDASLFASLFLAELAAAGGVGALGGWGVAYLKNGAQIEEEKDLVNRLIDAGVISKEDYRYGRNRLGAGGGNTTYNINVQAPTDADPFTFGERVSQGLSNAANGNFFLNGSNP